MKKILGIILLSIVTVVIFFLCFDYSVIATPNTYYQVYLNGESLGVINSKEKLEEYIDKKNNEYKKALGVKKIYAPNGLQIKKIETYSGTTSSVKEIYKKISKTEPFTIKGYKFVLRKANSDDDKKVIIYTLNKKVFDEAIESTIKTFVGDDEYESYLESTQEKITETGTIIENVYIEENITVKKVNISVDEKIYKDSASLAKFLVFGDNTEVNKYTVQIGDTIEDVAFKNEISVEEFLISNPSFSSSKNLLFPGQEVNIGVTDPQVSVIAEVYSVQDQTVSYSTELRYDENKVVGDDEVIQTGEDGLERITQRVKYSNGSISYVEPISKEELKPSINEIILKGDKYIPTVGSTTNWLWPTNSGYTISSGFIYRINPVTGSREIHAALDISGTGYGSPLYAVTNGVVSESSTRTQDGNYVCINHNNGYYTCYAHMSKRNVTVGQIVERGQVIGYVGQSGYATGPHLHFEVWVGGAPWNGGTRINPQLKYQ